jgi:aryl-alcohol dehydrogenase-like predicted oxidoreductase
VENSLRLLQTDYVDILQLHDIEFGDLDAILTDGYAELVRLRDEGKCRYIGVSGYALDALRRAMTETDLDVLLTYAHGTLLDDSVRTDLLPVAQEQGVGLINAAAVALGLLTSNPDWFRRDILPDGTSVRHTHPATDEIRDAAAAMIALSAEAGVDISRIANQYSIQRSGCATTVVGTVKSHHLQSAVDAAVEPIDEGLLARLLELRPTQRTW